VPETARGRRLAVESAYTNAIITTASQKRKALPAEFHEERRKVRDDQRSEARGAMAARAGRRACEGNRGGGLCAAGAEIPFVVFLWSTTVDRAATSEDSFWMTSTQESRGELHKLAFALPDPPQRFWPLKLSV
jgi:hypothetical protein